MSIHLVSIHQQMSSCLSGGAGRAYGLDLEMNMILKSPSSTTSSSTLTSHSPTLSESNANYSPFTISTRKPRTPRKRPNQTYNEAAALLSTAYPGIFSPNPCCKFTNIDAFFSSNSNSNSNSNSAASDDLLFPTHPTPVSEKPRFLLPAEPLRLIASCHKMLDGIDEDFQTETMLDGEIQEGIDSIMGINNDNSINLLNKNVSGWCYGYPMGWVERESSTSTSTSNLEWMLGQTNNGGVRALRHAADEGDWWRHPRVDVTEISPKFSKVPAAEKKKKKKLLEKINEPPPPPPTEEEEKLNLMNNNHGLLLKLNHDKLLAAWSDRGSPFSDEPPGNEALGVGTSNLHARLAQIDLFSGENGVREASVLRYKEKRRSRLFFKKIRYQVRKVNADQRPRLKGRFVRRPGSPFNNEEE